MAKPIHVVHVRNCRGITTLTGPERLFLQLLPKMDAARVRQTLVLTIDPDRPPEMLLEELERVGVSPVLAPVASIGGKEDLEVLRELILRDPVDILHTHDARSNVVASRIPRETRPAWVIFAHGWVNWDRFFSKARLYAWLEARMVRKADYIVAASVHMLEQVYSLRGSEQNVTRIPLAVDAERFSATGQGLSLREEWGVSPETALIGLVGRIHPWKGQDVFVDAAAKIVKSYPETKFGVIGDAVFGDHDFFRDELNAQINQHGLGDAFILTGSRSDIPAVMEACDVVAVPSRVEPFGLVSIEAQACSRPVVASNVGGLPETLDPGKTGLLVPPSDSSALAAAFGELLGNPEEMRRMGDTARTWVAREYGLKTMLDRYADYYEKIAANAEGENT